MTAHQTGRATTGVVSRIIANARRLLTGKAVSGVLSLAYLAIAARGLGPEGMGALVLAHAYAQVIAGVARFQSWQAVIGFGAPMLKAGEKDRFRRLLRYTIRLDLISGAGSVLIALALLPVSFRLFHWPEDVRWLIVAYCFATPFLIAATPTGVLRLYDRFQLLGWQNAIMPIVRFIGAVALLAAGERSVGAFLFVWIAGVVAHGVSLWWFGLRELKRQALTPRLGGPSEAPAEPEWLPFMIKTNLSSSITLLHVNAPVLIVGGVLGPAAAGLFKVAFNIANVLAQPIDNFNQATYPELSKVAAEHGAREMINVALRSIGVALLIAAPIVAIFWLLRRQLATGFGGPEFAAAAPLIALMAIAQMFHVAALGLESAVLARGRAGWALGAQGAGAAAHLGFLFAMLSVIGVTAAPLAIMTGWGVLSLVLIVALTRR